MGCSGSQVALKSDHASVGRARFLACSPTLLCSSCVVSTSKQHSFRVDSFSRLREQCCNSETAHDQGIMSNVATRGLWQRDQLALLLNGCNQKNSCKEGNGVSVSNLLLDGCNETSPYQEGNGVSESNLLNGCNETSPYQEGNGVSESNLPLKGCNETNLYQEGNGVSESSHCGRPGLDQGLTGALQIYNANRRTVEFAIEAPAERHERLKKLSPLLNGSNETNSDQHSNAVSQTNHCGRPSLDQGLIDAVVEQFPHDAETSKIRALQIYDANRRTVEFAIKASVEREERLKKLIRAGNGLCSGSASYNSTHISAAHSANEDNSNIEDNPMLEDEQLIPKMWN